MGCAGRRANVSGRQRVSSGARWETTVGYSRALRAGNIVHVAGTTSLNSDGSVHAPGDAYEQARRLPAHHRGRARRKLGASMGDVVRTRMNVTDIGQAEAVGRAHGERFGEVRPAATMVEVSRLIDPELVVEIEAEAVAGRLKRSRRTR
ncbi:MAG: RidA family protein [Dehalococcoidia bacterium]|nr:RidA family protein [Dehalococcoidia bacterium]